MSIKRKRIYEVLIISLIVVLLSLCAYMGIVAAGKSMKLNLSFTANPLVYCQLKIDEEVIFDNLTSKIGDGVEDISGNVLTFNKEKFASTMGVESFNLKISNYVETGSAILVEFGNASVNGKTNYSALIGSEGALTFSITPIDLVQIKMTKVIGVVLSNDSGVTFDFENSNLNITSKGEYYLIRDNDLKVQISVHQDYKNPKYALNNGENVNIENDQFEISYNSLKNNINISLTLQTSERIYTIHFNANGGTGTMASVEVPVNKDYYLPANIYEKEEEVFRNWNTSSNGSGTTYLNKAKIKNLVAENQEITLYAQWGTDCHISYNYSRCNVLSAPYTVELLNNGEDLEIIFNDQTSGGLSPGYNFEIYSLTLIIDGVTLLDVSGDTRQSIVGDEYEIEISGTWLYITLYSNAIIGDIEIILSADNYFEGDEGNAGTPSL